MTITLRATKGSALTWDEMDDNFTFTQSGTGAVATDLQTKLRQTVSLFDRMTAAQIADVQSGAATLDVTTAVQAALTIGGRIYAPGGTYLCSSLSLSSNTELFGDGNGSTIFKAKNGLNAQLFKNSDTSGGNTNISLRDFRINGNSANQSSGDRSGIVFQKVTYGLIENVRINDITDWSFGMYEGDYITLKNCVATAMVGINDTNGVRAGYLFGTSSTLRYANNVTVENCVASDVTQPFVDGFIFEQGTGIIVRGCIAKNVPYTGFKLNSMHNADFLDNHSVNCLVGFQKLGANNNVSYIGNLAYRNSGAGFYLGNSNTGTPSQGLIVHSNRAIDNGQNAYSALYGASGSRYGIAFEGTTSATVDRVSVKDNVCIDNGGATQGRGISFGTNGTFSNIFIGGNLCKGNTADFVPGASLDQTTLTFGPHVGFDSGSQLMNGGQSRQSLHFWVDNVAASAGVTLLSDGFSGRGYIMPKAGYLLGIYVKSNAAVTAGTVTFVPRKNGVDFGSGLSITSGTFNTREETYQSAAFSAGDIITCRYSSDGSLTPNGTDDFDVTVVVIY